MNMFFIAVILSLLMIILGILYYFAQKSLENYFNIETKDNK